MVKTPSLEHLDKILTALKKYPGGIWIRALARELKMPLSSLHYRLYKYLSNDITFERIEEYTIKGGPIIIKIKNARKRK